MADQPMTGAASYPSGSGEGSSRQVPPIANSFTPDQLLFIQQLLSMKNNNDDSKDSRHRLPWPKWDGKKQTFELFYEQLEAKVEEDHGAIGSGRSVCLGIYMAIPNSQQARVQNWFRNGNAHNWDWHQFLRHILS
ncbi:uncharacterized protein BROUX77_007032 [Berkeleyomyces rouxiae]|uniref:uncharacterized protein n=1 Tax=Berkeleyomyces rouxiae TaxID=2035830 RepID=UPI003B80BE05